MHHSFILGDVAFTGKGVADVAVLDPLLLLHQLIWAQAGCHIDLVNFILH
jgi:hypothetical protein